MSLFKTCCLLLLIAGEAQLALADAGSESIVAAGRERFVDACAFCHGLSGRGNGMAAGMMEKQPSDLTRLSKNNQGQFPLAEVYSIIDGRAEVSSHGSRDMPVWGDVWKKNVPPEYSEYYVRGRILELILYLESIQVQK